MLEVIDYVLERRCPSGGYCFYKLDEPNASDTFFALMILKSLCLETKDQKTKNFLLSLQYEDGFYQSIETCFYSVRGLALMDATPKYDFRKYIFVIEEEIKRAIRSSSSSHYKLIKHCYFISWLKGLLEEKVDKIITDFAHEMKNSDFLSERFFAIKCLLLNKEEIAEKDQIKFLRDCESPHLGFTESPHIELFHMEQQYMGVTLCKILGVTPLYPEAVEEFVRTCQKNSGGFARSETGIATLEDTFYGVSTLKKIKAMLTRKEKQII